MDSIILRELEIQPFVKLIALRIDLLLEAEIIAEENFAINDEFGIAQFRRKYIGRDDCVIVSIEM